MYPTTHGADRDHEITQNLIERRSHDGTGLIDGRLAGATCVDRGCDARDEPQDRARGDGASLRCSRACADAGRPLDFAEPARACVAPIPHHAVEHVDRGDQSLETEGPAAAPGRWAAGRLDLRRRAPVDRRSRAALGLRRSCLRLPGRIPLLDGGSALRPGRGAEHGRPVA